MGNRIYLVGECHNKLKCENGRTAHNRHNVSWGIPSLKHG